MKIGSKITGFGLQNFTLVIKFKLENLENENLMPRQNCRVIKYFF